MKFKLEIALDSASMQDQHDVATLLRSVAQRLNRFVSSNWGPYASSGKIYDDDGNKVGTWEVVPS
jgi:hypothetical protein